MDIDSNYQEKLILQLKNDDSYHKRASAAEKLGAFKSEKAVEALIQSLNDEYPDVQVEAIFALGEIGNSLAAPHICAHLEDEISPSTRIYAAEALAKLKYKPAIPQLLNLLRDKDWLNRESAAEGLWFFKDESTLPALLKALEDKQARVVTAAALALGNIKSIYSTEGLTKTLKHEDAFVRQCSVEALGLIGSKKSLPDLTLLLNDENDLVRTTVRHTIKKLNLAEVKRTT